MASIKYGPFVTSIKGKIGGIVFQGNVNGDTVKLDAIRDSAKLTKADAGRVFPTGPVISRVSGAWRDLSDAERASWVTGAVNFPAVNKFGLSYTPSGYQVFMKLNSQFYNYNGSIMAACPVPASMPALPTFSLLNPTLTSLEASWSGSLAADHKLIIEATQPMALGNQAKNSFYKIIKAAAASSTSPLSIYTEYIAIYGSFPANANIWFRFTYVNLLTGEKGISQTQVLLTQP